MKVVIITEQGADVPPTKDGRYDAHVRLEDVPGGGKRIIVDRFNFQIKDNARAHIESKDFAANMEGVREATDYLRGYGFDVTLAGSVEWH